MNETRMLAIIDRRTYMIELRILAISDRRKKHPASPLASRCWRSLIAAEKIRMNTSMAITDRTHALNYMTTAITDRPHAHNCTTMAITDRSHAHTYMNVQAYSFTSHGITSNSIACHGIAYHSIVA